MFFLTGLRGAIPYALSLHLGLEPIEKRQLIGTTTIIIVLFTILVLGGGTMPLIRLMDIEGNQSRRKNKKDINLSKTQKMVMVSESWWHACAQTQIVGCLRSFIRRCASICYLQPWNIKGLILVCVKDAQSAGSRVFSSHTRVFSVRDQRCFTGTKKHKLFFHFHLFAKFLFWSTQHYHSHWQLVVGVSGWLVCTACIYATSEAKMIPWGTSTRLY